jgi:hypothetical protein
MKPREWTLYGPNDDVSPDQIERGPEIGQGQEVAVVEKAAFEAAVRLLKDCRDQMYSRPTEHKDRVLDAVSEFLAETEP